MPTGPVLGDAILRLQPNAQYRLREENLDTLEWVDDTIPRPSDYEIIETLEVLRAEFEAAQYRRNRANAYPPIGDQLDDLFKAGLFSPEMTAKLQAVKDAFPKPEENI